MPKNAFYEHIIIATFLKLDLKQNWSISSDRNLKTLGAFRCEKVKNN